MHQCHAKKISKKIQLYAELPSELRMGNIDLKQFFYEFRKAAAVLLQSKGIEIRTIACWYVEIHVLNSWYMSKIVYSIASMKAQISNEIWCFWGLRLIWLHLFNFHPKKNTNDSVQFISRFNFWFRFVFIYFFLSYNFIWEKSLQIMRGFFPMTHLNSVDTSEPSCQIYLFHIFAVLERT